MHVFVGEVKPAMKEKTKDDWQSAGDVVYISHKCIITKAFMHSWNMIKMQGLAYRNQTIETNSRLDDCRCRTSRVTVRNTSLKTLTAIFSIETPRS